jgi:signal transduction histidine kinase
VKPRGAWLSLPGKLTLLAFVVLLVITVIILVLAHVTRDSPLAVRFLLFALALSPAVFIVNFLARFIAKRVSTALINAYTGVAAGNFATRFPPTTAGSDFISVREAFANMAAALEEAMNALREADLDRRRLFADLAHELATPTTTLLGIAHALRSSPATADVPRLLDHLESETGRLERLIADVREIAHLEDPALSMNTEPCDLGELVNRVVERTRIARPSITLRYARTTAQATVDPLRIDQVVTNLLDNAARHAGTNGTVSIALTTHPNDHRILIEDSGAGVPDDVLPQLGRRMLRLDPSRASSSGGHGLGLSIVCVIVERHGGDVTFGRASLGGLSVDVRLPRSPS